MSNTTPPQWIAPDDRFTYIVIGGLLFGLLIVLISITRRLTATASWSLADALSEEAERSVPDANGKPYTVEGQIIKETHLAASSSRLIAFLGTVAILFLFLGFGIFALWGFAKTGNLPPSTGSITTFLSAGLTLFAPYAVNKLSSVVSSN